MERPLPIEIRALAPDQTWPLRRAVLRPHASDAELDYAGDRDPHSLHAGAFAGDELVGVATVSEQAPSWEDTALAPQPWGAQRDGVWRLRGMAALPDYQRAGIGRRLLERCFDHVAAHGGSVLWCNARTSAIPFYERTGFAVHGEVFQLPPSGPHVVMWRRMGPAGH